MTRTWNDGTAPFLSAANLNAMEGDITTAAGVPDGALAARINDPTSTTAGALNATYAKSIPDSLDSLRGAALLPFWSALANRANAPVDVMCMGHSFIEGVHSSSVNQTFPTLFRDAMRGRFQPSGVAGGFGFKTRPAVSYFSDEFLTVTGGAANSGYGLGRKSWMLTAGGQTYTYASIPVTGFDIFFTGYSTGGTGYYKVDGGSATTFSTVNATVHDGMRIQVRGLAAGTHTVEVGWSSGGTVFMGGMMIYNGDESKGIRVWENAQSSTPTSWWTDAANPRWIDNVATIQPSLVVISDLCNDFGGNAYSVIPSATSKANMQATIANIRSVCTTPPSFVICTEWERSTTGGTTPSEPWVNYVNAAKSIAASDRGVLTWDMGARFGPGPFSTGTPIVNADKIHPTNAGMQLWADGLAQFVSPR